MGAYPPDTPHPDLPPSNCDNLTGLPVFEKGKTMHKGITPTITLTLPEDINLEYASNVYVTFADAAGKMTKTGDELVISANTITVTLSQEETLSFKPGAVQIQVNWTYQDGGETKRAASDVASIIFKANLEGGVLA